ncbi:MAG: HxsD-like protein [Candidatus Nanoarchaeia archaeon]
MELTIKVNPAFYDGDCIKETLQAFHDVCTGTFENNILVLTPKTDDIATKLKYEFFNYVLALMKNKSVV